MSEAIEISMEDIHSVDSAALVAEAAAESVVKSGPYLAKVGSFKLLQNGDDHQWHPGRKFANLLIELYDAEDVTVKKGRVFKKVSWEKRFSGAGRLDGQCKDYVAFLQAVGASGSDNPMNVCQAGMANYFIVEVVEKVCAPIESLHPEHMENIRGDGDQWVNITSDEQRAHYLGEGIESMAMVNRFKRVK